MALLRQAVRSVAQVGSRWLNGERLTKRQSLDSHQASNDKIGVLRNSLPQLSTRGSTGKRWDTFPNVRHSVFTGLNKFQHQEDRISRYEWHSQSKHSATSRGSLIQIPPLTASRSQQCVPQHQAMWDMFVSLSIKRSKTVCTPWIAGLFQDRFTPEAADTTETVGTGNFKQQINARRDVSLKHIKTKLWIIVEIYRPVFRCCHSLPCCSICGCWPLRMFISCAGYKWDLSHFETLWTACPPGATISSLSYTWIDGILHSLLIPTKVSLSSSTVAPLASVGLGLNLSPVVQEGPLPINSLERVDQSSQKLAVASWSYSCFSKGRGRSESNTVIFFHSKSFWRDCSLGSRWSRAQILPGPSLCNSLAQDL